MQAPREIERLLAHEASDWLEILRTEGGRREEFVEWVSQSQLHVDAFLKTLAVDAELDFAGAEARRNPAFPMDVAALLRMIEPRVVKLPRNAHVPTKTASAPARKTGWIAAAIAAGVAAVTAGLWILRPAPLTQTSVMTAAGEQRTVALPDASRVTLNGSSEIRVRYSAQSREVELRGEGIFKVSRDPQRPFIVSTPLARVRAVGTEFNVRERGTNGARVSVLEGRVQVLVPGSAESSGAAAQYLGAGEELEVLPTGRMERSAHANVAVTVAWRARRLPVEGASLDELIQEFNRYSGMRFRVEGPAPATRYGGIFDATDAQSLADYLSREPDLVVERQGDEFVIRGRTVQTPR